MLSCQLVQGVGYSPTFSHALSLVHSGCLEDKDETLHKVHNKSMQANTDSTLMLDLANKFLESLPHCLMPKC